MLNGRCSFCNLTGRHLFQELVEEEIGEEVVLGEVVGTAGAIALVVEVGDDAHVAEAVATGGEEGVPNKAHADRAQQILVIK